MPLLKTADRALSGYVRFGGAILLTIALVGAAIAAAVFLRDHTIGAWLLVVVGLPLLILIAVAYLVGRRERPLDDEAAVERLEKAKAATERALVEVSVATSYLANIDDFLTAFREAFASGLGGDARSRLEQLRPVIFDAVIQGINSTREEHIRCVFFKPVQEGQGTVLRPVAHHGHTADVEKLKLWADDRSAAGRAFSTGERIYIPKGARGDRRVQEVPEQKPMESLLCVPVWGPTQAGSSIVGVFSVDSTREDAFALSDRKFADVCASLLGQLDFFLALIDVEEADEGSGELEPGVSELEHPNQAE